ncbi:MAG TPA: methyltransferase domain-containing protein [Anaerolineae bacterium]|nr:methyltransferase domain-containing protein [Anaerolineae bacterium]
MQDDRDKSIALGHPSYVWRFGQERRLALIRRHAPLEGRRILDVGCGVGIYIRALRALSDQVYGVELDLERAAEAAAIRPHVAVAPAEALPFPADAFDAVLLHEVLEHVEDDRQAMVEACRVARPGGRIVVFVPNRLYPFETHGAYWRGRYHFGNIPLINYLPDAWRRRFAPHVRAYTIGDLRRLFEGLDAELLVHTQIYPGYDKIAAHRPGLAAIFRGVTYALERTPLRVFGLSHFAVLEKARLR